MYHSVTFEDAVSGARVNTWDNWGLIPTSRPVIVQPTPIFKPIEVPGRDGTLDATDYLVGRPTYSDRKGTLEFLAVNVVGNYLTYGSQAKPPLWDGFQKESAKPYSGWADRRTNIANFLTGKKMKLYLQDDDPLYYYYGRIYFKDWKPETPFSKVIIEYQLGPYRYLVNGGGATL